MPTPLKKIFITGAGGMLGSDLVRHLHGPFEVLGAGITAASHLSCSYYQFDLTDFSIAASKVKPFAPQLIFHCAAFTDVDAYERDPEKHLRENAALVESMVKLSNQTGALLIFFSTDYVFDGKKQGEYLESDPLNPKSVYGKSKAEAETYIQKNAAHYAIFRISWLYGTYGKSFPRTIWEKSKTQNLFKVVSDQIGRPTFTKDIAAAFKQLLSKPDALQKIDKQIIHLGNTGQTSWADLASFILDQGSTGGKVEKITSGELNRAAQRPENSVLSLEKAEKTLGIRLRTWQSAVAEFLQDLAKEPLKAS